MSSRRIIIGLLIGGCLLTGGLAAVWYLGLPERLVPGVLLVVAGVGWPLSLEKRYGIDLHELWRDDLTLGELYERTRTRTA